MWFLITGFLAGAIAKGITPQNEDPGWISSIIIGIVGSFVGKFVFGFFRVNWMFGGIVGDLIVATVGALIFLYVYHKWLSDKIKLPI